MSTAMISFLGSTVVGSGQAVPQVVSATNPLPVSLSGGIGGLSVAGTVADGAAVGAQFPVTVGGVDYATGFAHRIATDVNGVVSVNVVAGGGSSVVQQGAGNTANPWTVGGPVAAGAAVSGNPVLGGAVFNAAPTGVTAGNVAILQTDSNSNLRARLVAAAQPGGDLVSNSVLSSTTAPNSAAGALNPLAMAGFVFNGVSWDRLAKPRTAFRLPSAAATNNAANIKATPGTVYQVSANVTLAASTCYLKFFDTTGVPNPAALVPLYIFALNVVDGAVSFNLGNGLYFPTGIGVAVVANPADLDNTAIAAGQVTALNVSFQ